MMVEYVEALVILRFVPLSRLLQAHRHRTVADQREAELGVEDQIGAFPPRPVGYCNLIPEKLVRCADEQLVRVGSVSEAAKPFGRSVEEQVLVVRRKAQQRLHNALDVRAKAAVLVHRAHHDRDLHQALLPTPVQWGMLSRDALQKRTSHAVVDES